MTEEEKDAYMASRITDLADSIIMIKKYVEMFEHKPMVKADSDRCDNTIDYYHDAIHINNSTLTIDTKDYDDNTVPRTVTLRAHLLGEQERHIPQGER